MRPSKYRCSLGGSRLGRENLISGCVSPQRGWKYDGMLDPEFNRFWKNVDDVRLVSEISGWVGCPKAVGPRFALDSGDIDRGLSIERRLPESLIRLAQVIQHICVPFGRTSPHNWESFSGSAVCSHR